MFKSFLKVYMYIFTLVLFTACSQKQEAIKIVIPGPPEEPKIFFDTAYRGDISFVKQNTLDNFIGEVASSENKNLAKPYGVAASKNVVYVSDTAIGAVFVIDEVQGKVSYIGASSPGKLSLPVGIALSDDGKIYVADAKAAKVLAYDRSDGHLVLAIGKEKEFNRPADIAISDKQKRLYVVDTKDHNIKVYSLEGEELFSFGKRGKEDGEFNFPTNIAIDKRNENIVVVDTQNFRVQIFDKDGKFIKKFGKIGDRPGMFARPKGVGIDSDGNIYVTDSAFNNIQVFNESGELLIYFGGTGRSIGNFSLITGMYIDGNDRIYIVDGFNARVQIYQYVSERWKKNNPEKYLELKKI
ncbi:MAG: 6-bladed beta-propeller [Sulfurimonas sp.]|nr:6-bladed beta-propeller [Sulfurimonas sp.]